MHEKEAGLLKDVCAETVRDHAKLFALTGDTAESCGDDIVAYVDSFQGMIAKVQTESQSLAEDKFQPYLACLDLGLVLLFDLAMTAERRSEVGEPVIWQSRRQTDRGLAEPSFVFHTVISGLTNTLLGVRTLIRAGLDNQARVLHRSYLELAGIILAITDSEALYEAYLAPASNKDAYAAWSKNFREAQLKGHVKRIGREIGVPAQALASWQDRRARTYGWLSQFAHGSWAPQLVRFTPLEAAEEYERSKTALLGRATSVSKDTLSQAAEATRDFLAMLLPLLRQKHGWEPQTTGVMGFMQRLTVFNRTIAKLG